MLHNKINKIKQIIDGLEYNNVENSVEIKGIYKTINENCMDIVHKITKKVIVDIFVKPAMRIIYSSNNSTSIL